MTRTMIDLTFPIHDGMVTYPVPWHPYVEITQMGRHGIENRETRKIALGSHTGTHIDAPRHFIKDGLTVDEIPLDILVGPAYMIDFSSVKPFQTITIDDLNQRISDKLSSFPKRLVLRFDWDKHWGQMNYYTDQPYLSLEAANWLIKKGVKLIAMDTPMPDNPKNGKGSLNDSPIHKIMLKNEVVIVEYLCNLDKVQNSFFELVVLPLKIKNGDGSPARCIAIENDNE